MIQNIKMFLIIVLTLAVTSCYDDEGSYDYVDVNEITIEGLEETYSKVFKKDVLEIEPKLTFTMDDGDPNRYAYEWEAMLYNDPDHPIVIGNEKNLSYFMELVAGEYALYLKVRDKKTMLLWIGKSRLSVRTETGRGFLLIGEDKEGYVNVDMIAMPNDTVVLKNLLSNNGLPRLKGPRNVCHTGGATGARADFIKLWVMTDDRSYYVNTTTFQGYTTNTFERLVYSNIALPEELNPVYLYTKSNYPTGGAFSTRIVICDDGSVFKTGLSTEEAYPNPLNRLSTTPDETFRAYPCVYGNMSNFFGGAGLYDMEHNQFVCFRITDLTCSPLSDKATDVFPWKQPEGRVMIYSENTPGKASLALMKDEGTGDFHIYNFSMMGIFNSKYGYYAVDKSLATDMDKADMFAFSSSRTLLFYAVGKTLYAYDYNPGNERLYTMSLEDDITMVKFDYNSSWNYNGLYVATYNESEGGILQRYELGGNPNILDLNADPKCRWSGLVKIVNMDWRNSAN